MKRIIFAALGLLALIATPVLAAGLWPNFPVVGGASYCASTSTGVSGQVCTVTVPAGPTALTGAETVPADTNLTQGQPPQTVRVPVTSLASGAYANVSPLTGTSVVIPNNVSNYLITPAGTIAALTVTMPSAPTDGQVVHINSSATVTALTLNGASGQTISNAPTAITISTTVAYGYAFLYQASTKKWMRLQ
jgi:hypothetical protein